ncbi:MAG: hypothetical protein H0X45_09410 [Planctomycetes bacterium]|nr:hypothetical protein [Planctomycetota bacterium]
MATRGSNLEIGLGGDIGDDLGIGVGKPFAEWLRALRREVQRIDPRADIDFLEGCNSPENAAIAAAEGMPYRQFTDLYVIGGKREGRDEDALATLRRHLDAAAATQTITALNMQVWGVRNEPSLDQICDFYHAAEAMAAPYRIGLFTETHVDRFTYDPRRLLAVHDRLMIESRGAYGLRVGADFSHYVHQLGNPTGDNWQAIRSGALRLDPFDVGNVVSTRIIQGGLVGYGHLRCAAPNDRGRDRGSIQYPLVDPAAYHRTPWQGELACGGTWDESRTRQWREFYRQTFAYQIAHPERPVARFSSEFIGWNDHCDYRIEGYSNAWQNFAAVAWAQALKRELVSTAVGAAGR